MDKTSFIEKKVKKMLHVANLLLQIKVYPTMNEIAIGND